MFPAGIVGVHCHAQPIKTVCPREQIQVLVLEWHVLFQLSHVPGPRGHFEINDSCILCSLSQLTSPILTPWHDFLLLVKYIAF